MHVKFYCFSLLFDSEIILAHKNTSHRVAPKFLVFPGPTLWGAYYSGVLPLVSFCGVFSANSHGDSHGGVGLLGGVALEEQFQSHLTGLGLATGYRSQGELIICPGEDLEHGLLAGVLDPHLLHRIDSAVGDLEFQLWS